MNIKDFAIQEGVTTQAVYKLLKTHKEALTGHVLENKKGRDLDEYAQIYLKDHMLGNNVICVDQAMKNQIADLKNRLEEKQDKVLELQKQLEVSNALVLKAQNQIIGIEQTVEDRAAELIKEKESEMFQEWQVKVNELKQQLDEERTRKLTWRERLVGHRKRGEK